MFNKNLKPKVILITGCSSGFGMLTAARLTGLGHKVIATMRDLSKSAALTEEVTRRKGEIKLFKLDVRDKNSIKTVMTEVAAKYGNIDVLVNNAGYGIGGFFEDLTDEEMREQFETNFFGVQNVTRAAIPLMRQNKGSKIIMMSSRSAFSGSPALSAYSATKWALEGFAESLRYELQLFGIQVILIEPGPYKTKIFHENARFAKNFLDETSPYYPYSRFLEKRVKDHLSDLHKDPEEVAALIEKIINTRNPAFRHMPDIETYAQYLLNKFLPFRLYSTIVRKAVFHGMKSPAQG